MTEGINEQGFVPEEPKGETIGAGEMAPHMRKLRELYEGGAKFYIPTTRDDTELLAQADVEPAVRWIRKQFAKLLESK